ncbi:MAG: threonylcarbamoyl-AMP synthase, partial [Verrucomicrobia bacterium]
MAKIYSGSDADLAFLSEVLRQGGLVAVPTETVYGLAANALDAEACRKIFEVKGRPAHDPFIVHVSDLAAARAIARLNPLAERLAEQFWPGPLTLVLPKAPAIPDIVTSGRPTVAVRVPGHPLFRRLLATCALPLAAPSANPFGYVSPTTAAHVLEGLGERIGHILDGGPATIGVESTIIDVRDESAPVILRPGGISRENLELATDLPFRIYRRGNAAASPSAPSAAPEGELAPGMLDKHYSPRTRLHLAEAPFPSPADLPPAERAARVY